MKTLKFYEKSFLHALAQDLNPGAAAKAAGYRGNEPMEEAMRILMQLHVQEDFFKRMQAQATPRPDTGGPTQETILERLWAIASANPAELLHTRRESCRCCWGQNHEYQRTPREYRQHLAAGGEPEGGPGFNPGKAPHPDCPECFGRGVIRTELADLDQASPQARALIRNIEVTSKGIKLSFHSQLRALELVGKVLGMFRNKPEPRPDHEQRMLQAQTLIQAANGYKAEEEQKLAAMTPEEQANYRHGQDANSLALAHANFGNLPTTPRPNPWLDDPVAAYLREWMLRQKAPS